MSIDELAALIRARLDHLEALARDAIDEPWQLQNGYDGPGIKVGETDGWWRMGEATSAAYRCNDPLDDCDSVRASYRAEGQLILACAEPAAVLREVAAKRALLDQWQAAKNQFEEAAAHPDDYHPADGGLFVGQYTALTQVIKSLAQPYRETS